MNNKTIFFSILSFIIVVALGFFFFTTSQLSPLSPSADNTMKPKVDQNVKTTNPSINTNQAPADGYTGQVLAGTMSPFLVYSKADFEKALASEQVIVLDFYADWCPECRREAPFLDKGFETLNREGVIGFRVNYNDTQTDADERALAGKYAITYQHTKVILKNGEVFSKSVEVWDTDTFLNEVKKAL